MGTLRELGYSNYVFGGDSSVWDDINETVERPDFLKAAYRGWKFNYLRTSFGLYKDTDYDVNWANSRKTTLLLGNYHFLVWDKSPETQADFFWSIIKDDPGELPLIVDFEWWSTIPSNAFDILYRFLERLKKLTTKRLGIYTAYSFWKQYGKTDDYWKQYVLWLARYETTPPIGSTQVPLPWTTADFWQYTGHGDGIYYGMESKDVDLDYFMGSWEELLALCDLGVSMYEDKALAIYVDSNRKVSDWDKLASDVDFVFLRAMYVPLTSFGGGKYFNSDTAKTLEDYLNVDPDYVANFKEAKKRGLKVVTTVELNTAFDKDTSYSRQDQVQHIKRSLTMLGDVIGDAVAVQITMYQWVESSAVKTITAPNFKDCLKNFFPALYNEMGKKTVYGWSTEKVLKMNTAAYPYESMIRDGWLDGVNSVQPTFPFGFTYQSAPGWGTQITKFVNSVRETVSLLPPLTTGEISQYLRIGSHTGWNQKSGNGEYNHGFFSAVGTKVPYMTGYVEPIVFDTDKATFFKWMGWNVVTPIDTEAPTQPQNLIVTEVDTKQVLSWQASTDNVGVAGYYVIGLGNSVGITQDTSYVVPALPPGVYSVMVKAFDQVGNTSLPATLDISVGGIPPEKPLEERMKDVEVRLNNLKIAINKITVILSEWQ